MINSVWLLAACFMSNQQPDDSKILPEWFAPSDLDVICGWARQNHNHVGNHRFREVIDRSAPHYLAARTKLEKTQVIAAVIDKVRSDSPGGGFVRKDFYSSRWYEIGDEKARDKVGHAIRKAAEQLQKTRSNNPATGHIHGSAPALNRAQQHRLAALSNYPPSAIPNIPPGILQPSSTVSSMPLTFSEQSTGNTSQLLARSLGQDARAILQQNSGRLPQHFGLRPHHGIPTLHQQSYNYQGYLQQLQLSQLSLEQQAMLNSSSTALRGRIGNGLPNTTFLEEYLARSTQTPNLASNPSALQGRFSSLQSGGVHSLPSIPTRLDPLNSFLPLPGQHFREAPPPLAGSPVSVPISTNYATSTSAFPPIDSATCNPAPPRAQEEGESRARRIQSSTAKNPKSGEHGEISKDPSTDDEDRKVQALKK